MSSKYFKVVYGFDEDEYIAIDDSELKKAIYAHLTGKKVAFKEGSVSGDKIIVIRPDWNKAMGWNVGYKPTPEEMGEIDATVGKKYLGIVAHAKDEVEGYIKSGQLEKLNTPLLESSTKIHTKGLTQIGKI